MLEKLYTKEDFVGIAFYPVDECTRAEFFEKINEDGQGFKDEDISLEKIDGVDCYTADLSTLLDDGEDLSEAFMKELENTLEDEEKFMSWREEGQKVYAPHDIKLPITILSIIPGVSNLYYYALLNQSGEILKQGDLNTVHGVNYLIKLQKRDELRAEMRKANSYEKSWIKAQRNKDLIKGYHSGLVNVIGRMCATYGSIIILIDYERLSIKTIIPEILYKDFIRRLNNKLSYFIQI